MGFPNWTLWGMAISGFAALILLMVSLLLQSRIRSDSPVEPVGFAQRIRGLTTYALALLMLSIGFFVAGFPSSATRLSAEQTAVAIAVKTVQSGQSAPNELADNTLPLEQTPLPTESATSETGAFSGPPPTDEPTATPEPEETETDANTDTDIGIEEGSSDSAESPPAEENPESEDATPEATAEPLPTATPVPTATPTHTATPSPTPTATPQPTHTPTPIDTGETVATISTGGSTLWLRRTPGGPNSLILNNEDTVLVQLRNANQAGVLWKEVKTTDGVIGWVQADFLSINDNQ